VNRPSFASLFAPSASGGRRESRVRAAPAVSSANAHRKTHTSIQVQRRQSGLPCAMVLTVSFVLSPVTGLFCHRHFADHLRKAERQRRGARTTRLRRRLESRSSVVTPASTASHRNVRDDR